MTPLSRRGASRGRPVKEDSNVMEKRGVAEGEDELAACDTDRRDVKAAAETTRGDRGHRPCGEDVLSRAAEAAARSSDMKVNEG